MAQSAAQTRPLLVQEKGNQPRSAMLSEETRPQRGKSEYGAYRIPQDQPPVLRSLAPVRVNKKKRPQSLRRSVGYAEKSSGTSREQYK